MKSITAERPSPSSLSLVCRARGGPLQATASLSWTLPGGAAVPASGRVTVRSVRRSKSILTVLGVSEEDAGLYTCTASSPAGPTHD